MPAKRIVIATLLLLLGAPARADTLGTELREQRHLIEVGPYLGAFLPAESHGLYDVALRHEPLASAAFSIGARAAYLPWPFFGVELEGGAMPTSTESDRSAMLYAIRGHALVQYPARIAPFLVIGGGALGISSDDDALGSDVDSVFHWGLGVKGYVTRWLALRLDARHEVGERLCQGRASHFEVLAGAALVLGWPGPESRDSDGDGVNDAADLCPKVAASTPDGCPPKDADSDGVPDEKDSCPQVAAPTADGCPPDGDRDGVPDDKDTCPTLPAQTPDGCPGDTDGDGLTDDRDACPKDAHKTPDGCPPKDTDSDGLTDDLDRCPDQAETRNGFEDEDGCPDELPAVVQRFTGAIKGINFAAGKAVITPASFKTLDEAVKVLNDYPTLKLKIRGHTDNQGKEEANLALSQARADAVKAYLAKKGIAEERLTTEGVGPKEPVADNAKPAGRAANRRIEFKLE